jgi:hypothetical protein
VKNRSKPERMYANRGFYNFVKSHGWVKIYSTPDRTKAYFCTAALYRVLPDGKLVMQLEFQTQGRKPKLAKRIINVEVTE